MSRKITLTAEQARAIFDALQVAQTHLALCADDATRQTEGRRYYQLKTRIDRIDATFNFLSEELQDIAAPTFEEGT